MLQELEGDKLEVLKNVERGLMKTVINSSKVLYFERLVHMLYEMATFKLRILSAQAQKTRLIKAEIFEGNEITFHGSCQPF